MVKNNHRVARSRILHFDGPADAVGGLEGLHDRHEYQSSVFSSESANGFGHQRLAAGIAGVYLVPECHVGLAQTPAEKDLAAAHHAREINETDARILDLNPEVGELATKTLDIASE